MLYAVRGNKQLKIDEAEKETYLKLGYDIAEANGDKLDIVAVSSAKTVPYAEYKKLQEENAVLKDQLAARNAVELKKNDKKLKATGKED